MTTFILGQTLVFWSGIAAAGSFLLLIATCSYTLGCARGACPSDLADHLFRKHKYFVWLSAIAVLLHIALALMTTLFSIWL